MATNKISFAVKRPRLYRPRFEAKGIRASAKKKKDSSLKLRETVCAIFVTKFVISILDA